MKSRPYRLVLCLVNPITHVSLMTETVSLTAHSSQPTPRRRTRVVMVGDVAVGGDNPIRVQSMTTTLTKDIEATVAQVERLVAAGCEIVRITTPTPSDARCLGPIREKLAARGIRVPIVADIHFSPAAALAATEFADKVRVNPGNYTDSRKFAVREYTDEQYDAELARVEERFTPLVLACKERGIAMRIGTNHGSLSDRIMNRFGDTPEGMVESALEFARICRTHDYHDLIFSMKASNPKVMIAAYRLLAARMEELEWDYPFHLGVTEAGNAEDGRIKSAIGIGSLLEDGIGDTIRVSLTEEPEAEIPVAYAIAERYRPDARRASVGDGPRAVPRDHETDNVAEGFSPQFGRRPRHVEVPTTGGDGAPKEPVGGKQPATEEPSYTPWDPFHYGRRPSAVVGIGDLTIGGSHQVAVIVPIEGPLAQQDTAMARVLRWASPAGRRQPKPDATVVEITNEADLAALRRVRDRLQRWPQASLAVVGRGNVECLAAGLSDLDAVLVRPEDAAAFAGSLAGKTLVLDIPDDDDAATYLAVAAAQRARENGVSVLLSVAPGDTAIRAYRELAFVTARRGVHAPILLRATINPDPETYLDPAITMGSLLCDGIGDAVMVEGLEDSSALAFNILQAAGTRISKTDYVACPSCGRTLFDLQETTERIKARTSHLVGVRLAIMGCIVNGPGEMADADFGYVGGAPGQVNLYVGKECVEKGVPAEEADDRLVALIKQHGKWQEE